MRAFVLVLTLFLNTACAQRSHELRTQDLQIEENNNSLKKDTSKNKIGNKALFQLAFSLIF